MIRSATPRLADTPVPRTERLRLRRPVAADGSSFIPPDALDKAKAWRATGHLFGAAVARPDPANLVGPHPQPAGQGATPDSCHTRAIHKADAKQMSELGD